LAMLGVAAQLEKELYTDDILDWHEEKAKKQYKKKKSKSKSKKTKRKKKK
jgi:hypothetical protein